MHIEKNIAKHLIIGLIYPAVLGTAIYLLLELLVNHVLRNEELAVLENSWKIILLKSILLLVILIFYACDFLYTTYTKSFRTSYFFIDIVILIGLFASFKATNYDLATLPRFDLIIIYFIVFIFLYWCWDFYELSKSKNISNESSFYRKMVNWEYLSFAALIIILVLMKTSVLGYKWSASLATLIITVSTLRFIWLVRIKRDLFSPEAIDS